MQTQGASSLWGGSANLNGLESNWGIGTPYSSGANMNLLGFGSNSLSNNPGHMQSGASSSFGDLGTINSNPVLGNSNRGSWGAPGTLPPSMSTNRLPISSIGNMQVSGTGAQPSGPQSSGSATTSQSPGPNGVPASSQGNNAFGSENNLGFQKISSSNMSSGLGLNPGTSIMNSSGSGVNAQPSDNVSSGWGMPSSNDNSRLMGTSWGNPSAGGDWNQSTTVSHSQSQPIPPSSSAQFQNSNMSTQSATTDQQRPSSWAQAAGKGLNLNSNNPGAGASGNAPTEEEIQRQMSMRKAIESHDGWGKKPVNQVSKWNIETSPKAPRKFPVQAVVPDQQKGTNNMWNNNNGTAIWEANKDNTPAWNGNQGMVSRAPGPPPSSWAGAIPNTNDPNSNQWVGGPGQAPVQNKPQWGGGLEGAGQLNSNNTNWGGSTETGSWGGNFGPAPGTGASNGGGMNTAGLSSWGAPDHHEAPSSWGDNRNSGGNDGTSYWGDPQAKRPQPPPQQQPPPPPPPQQQPPNWAMHGGGPPNQQAIGQRPKQVNMGNNGWGDPIGPPDPKIDDGTSLWAANSQQQVNARAAGWGDTASQSQWNPAVGKPKPQMPTQNPAAFGGVDELNWNTPKEDVWSEESMGGWDDADMGTWNDTAQQANSSWNSATGWNRDKRNSLKDGAMGMKYPGGPNHQPQMRSRLLQQLVEMGFKKDEAQEALISNNMNLQNAITDLYSRNQGAIGSKKDTDMDMFQTDGNKSRMSGMMPDNGAQDDISDTQSDSNSFVPNINHMQNTPYSNAQSKIPNQYPFNNGPSLTPSSLNPNNPSINLQQKIMQKFQSQQPPPPTPQSMNSTNPTQGPMGRGQLPSGGQQNPAVQQQMAQQQILQQLRMSVQAGLISPQLLNQQLPPHMLVMLQQLLQQQQNLQQHIATQQMLQQPKVGMNPMVQKQQLDQVAQRINSIKQQILHIHRSINQAQAALQNKQSQQQSSELNESNLSTDLNNLSISSSQPQSRLNQWKRTTPDSPDTIATTSDISLNTTTSSSLDADGSDSSLNKAPGSKANFQQSSSSPNLKGFDLGLSHLGGDTWSTTSTSSSGSQNWPTTSTPTSTNNEVGGEKLESQIPSTSSSSISAIDTIPTIPEFVPGKPWQGITKNVEDDPHITPGSFHRSLSVNTIKADYINNLTKSSPTNELTSTWPSKPQNSINQSKPWSSGENATPTSFSSEVWGIPKGGMSRPPPGLPQKDAYSRQNSWAGSTSGSWDRGSHSGFSTALLLKNLTPQIDGSTLKTLCIQHGPLQSFYLNLGHGQALVKYNTREEAMKAQKSLNTCLLGNTTIVAELVPDEFVRSMEQQNTMNTMSMASTSPSQWPPQSGQSRSSAVGANNPQRQDLGLSSSWGVAPPTSSSLTGTGMWGNMGGATGSAGGLWGDDDNSTHNLLGNIMGETM